MSPVHPAGFWRRYLAWSVDWLLLTPVMVFAIRSPVAKAQAETRELSALLQDWLLDKLLGASGPPSPLALTRELMNDPVLLASVQSLLGRLTLAVNQALLSAVALAAIYFIGFESSAWRATPGKRLLDMAVVDLGGERVGWARTSARFLAGGLSWLSLNLGHALIGWRTDGRALHDLIAGTRVDAHSPMPRWGRWLLFAQLLLLLAVFVALLGRVLWLLAQLSSTA